MTQQQRMALAARFMVGEAIQKEIDFENCSIDYIVELLLILKYLGMERLSEDILSNAPHPVKQRLKQRVCDLNQIKNN